MGNSRPVDHGMRNVVDFEGRLVIHCQKGLV